MEFPDVNDLNLDDNVDVISPANAMRSKDGGILTPKTFQQS